MKRSRKNSVNNDNFRTYNDVFKFVKKWLNGANMYKSTILRKINLIEKKMRKLKFAAIAIIAVVALGACKKGENDPFLSLKSRNARITGVWDLTEGSTSTVNTTTVSGSTTTDTETNTYTSTTLTNNDNGTVVSIPYTQSIDIRKDGTYTRTIVADGSTNEFTGNWWWVNSKKKKVRIAFDDDYGSMYIDRLKNKELVLTLNQTDSDTQTGYSSVSTYTQTFTFEKNK